MCASCFLSDHVFGDYRRQLLNATLCDLSATAVQEQEQWLAGLRRAITDMDVKIKGTIRNLNSSMTPTNTSSATSTKDAPSIEPNANS